MALPKRDIFAVWGVEPEVGGYGLAKYSRSHKPYRETIKALDQKKASEFYKTFYLKYRHKSVADLAHAIFIFENISNYPAREALWDDSLLDGQESSTRYLDFTKKGICIPQEITESPFYVEFKSLCEEMVKENEEFQKLLLPYIKRQLNKNPVLKNLPSQKKESLAKSKVFDIARQLLPTGHYTNLGLVMSARTAERLANNLLAHPFEEVKEIARDFQKAMTQKAAFVPSRLPKNSSKTIVMPTVGTFIKPNSYRQKVFVMLKEWASRNLSLERIDSFPKEKVILIRPHNLELETLASFLYQISPYSYRQLLYFVERLSLKKRQELFKIIYSLRGQDDELLRESSSGYRLIFDITSDFGSHKDLHRHRRCIEITKPFTSRYGYVMPLQIEKAGLKERYQKNMEKVGALASRIENEKAYPLNIASGALLGYGWKRRYLIKMDARELQYIVELRTRPEGHFYYREIAWLMYQAFKKYFPHQAKYIRAYNPYKT